jgi:galactokinase
VSPVVLALDGWHLVTVDSGQRHANAGDAADGYNRRRAECVRACELLGIESLREATAELASERPSRCLAGRCTSSPRTSVSARR